MADPVGDETKSSSIMFVNLNGNGPKRGNPNDAGLPEAPEALFLINSLYEIDGFKRALPRALPLSLGAWHCNGQEFKGCCLRINV